MITMRSISHPPNENIEIVLMGGRGMEMPVESRSPKLLGKTVVLTSHHGVQLALVSRQVSESRCVHPSGICSKGRVKLFRLDRWEEPITLKEALHPASAKESQGPSQPPRIRAVSSVKLVLPDYTGQNSVASGRPQWACWLGVPVLGVPPRLSEAGHVTTHDLCNDTGDFGGAGMSPGSLLDHCRGTPPAMLSCWEERRWRAVVSTHLY